MGERLDGKMKPILFNTEMVRAILDDRKTKTRRLVKEDKRGQWVAVNNARNHEYGASVPCYLHREVSVDDKSRNIMYPKYDVGDILWVRETWGKDENGEYVYRTNYGTTEDDSFPPSMFKWKPSIHMPRKAARIFLRVTNVSVERLQDINEEDALKEGCRPTILDGATFFSAKGKFHALWDGLNAKRGYGWEANPWVWVYEFERVSDDGKRWWCEMITDNQKDYIESLYRDIDLEPEIEIEELTKREASNLIEELKQIKEEIS